MSFQMCPQAAWFSGVLTTYLAWTDAVTLLKILRFLSKTNFQMRPQTACMNRCKVALATFM